MILNKHFYRLVALTILLALLLSLALLAARAALDPTFHPFFV